MNGVTVLKTDKDIHTEHIIQGQELVGSTSRETEEILLQCIGR